MPTNKNNNSLLQQILQVISQVAQPIGQATGQAAVSGLNTTASALGSPAQLPTAEGAGQAVAQQMAPPENNAYQKGVEKALKEGGYAQTQEALQAGVPAEHIVQQAGLNQQQQLTQPNQQSSLQMNKPSGPFALGGANVNQQGQVQVNQTAPLMKGLLNWIGMGQNAFANQDIGTISGAQKVSGQEPIQPQQQFEAKRQALQNEVSGYNDQLKTLMDQFTQIRKSPIAVAKGMDRTVLKNLDIVNKKLSQSINRLKALGAGKQNEIPKGATHYSPSQNKYYDAKGNEVK